MVRVFYIWCFPVLTHSLMNRVEKYRPNTLDDVVSHKDITGTSKPSWRLPVDHMLSISVVENFIKKGRLPHLLFYGPPGMYPLKLLPLFWKGIDLAKSQVPEKHLPFSPSHV